jgi:carbamoyltransferase
MKVLGLGCPLLWHYPHDAAAALLVDGRLVAAVEEERLSRRKHATGELPVRSARFCLEAAGLRPEDVDVVAFGFSAEVFRAASKDEFKEKLLRRPMSALRRYRKKEREYGEVLRFQKRIVRECGFDPERTKVVAVPHHIAHAASSALFAGWPSCAFLTIDGAGEAATTCAGEAEGARFDTRYEVRLPDSLGFFYSGMTDYLGFEPNDGEYKVMGMAPYGDAKKADVSECLAIENGSFRLNRRLLWTKKGDAWAEGRHFGRRLVDLLGPPRAGDAMEPRHANIAAAVQERCEQAALHIVERHLRPILERHDGRLAFAGGVALNVTLNRKLLELPYVKRLWVQPAAGDAGVPLGAAALVAAQAGERIEPMTHAYWGPAYSDAEIEKALKTRKIRHRRFAGEEETIRESARMLAEGKVLAWFQGRVEFGPRALGNRSILGNPARAGTRDEINEAIKFREPWRPFCASMLAEEAPAILGTEHPAPFMNLSFLASEEWKSRIPEVVHVDGSMRPQTVTREANPLYWKLIAAFRERTGVPVLLNTSLNRRGEPMICSPDDALTMFFGSGLERLVMGNFLVEK